LIGFKFLVSSFWILDFVLQFLDFGLNLLIMF